MLPPSSGKIKYGSALSRSVITQVRRQNQLNINVEQPLLVPAPPSKYVEVGPVPTIPLPKTLEKEKMHQALVHEKKFSKGTNAAEVDLRIRSFQKNGRYMHCMSYTVNIPGKPNWHGSYTLRKTVPNPMYSYTIPNTDCSSYEPWCILLAITAHTVMSIP